MQRNWFQAFADCKKQNQNLVVIPDDEKLKEVQNLVEGLKLTATFDDFYDAIWIDGSDLGDEGQFIWMTTGKELDTTAIELVERSGYVDSLKLYMSRNENCLSIVKRNVTSFTFNDAPCSPHILYYLCEKADKMYAVEPPIASN